MRPLLLTFAILHWDNDVMSLGCRGAKHHCMHEQEALALRLPQELGSVPVKAVVGKLYRL